MIYTANATRPAAGVRQAAGAREGMQTHVSIILAQDADVNEYVGRFMQDPLAPCTDLASRRTYALAAFYIFSLFRDIEGILRGVDDVVSIDYEMLSTMLRSRLRLRRSTAAGIIHALLDAGMLAKVTEPARGVDPCQA